MVGDYTHSHVLLFVLAISSTRHIGNHFDDRLEYVRIVVGCLTLQSHAETFESHTGIDHTGRQRFERAVGLSVVLHEHQVPDFDHLRMVFVHHVLAGDSGTFFFRTEVDMDFRTRTARPRITHFPKVIVFVAINDMSFRQELLPIAGSLVVARKAFGRTSFEHGGIQTVGIQFQHFDQVFPCPVDRLLFEIVAERPVSQHFEHGVMIRIVSDLFQVVMLSTHTKTLL